MGKNKNKDNSKLKHRSPKGFGASHPFIEKSSTNLGKNPFSEKEIEKNPPERKKVMTSKAFKKIKVSESKIRKIVKEEIENIILEDYKWPWEEGASWDPRDSWLSDKVIEPTIETGVDVAVATAKSPFVAWDFWTDKGFSGGIEEFYEESTDAMQRVTNTYVAWLDGAKEDAMKRVVGSPPKGFYVIDRRLFKKISPNTAYNSSYKSTQLATENIFDAVTKFYNPPEIIVQKSTATWHNLGVFSDYSGELMWGEGEAGDPQYEWLAAKFKKYNSANDEDMLKILSRYAPADSDRGEELQQSTVDDVEDLFEDSSNKIHRREGYESPFFGLTQLANEEIRKIKLAMHNMRTDGDNDAVWRVFYGVRGMPTAGQALDDIRNAQRIMEELDGPVGWISTMINSLPGLNYGSSEVYQLCVFGHWTDDPRWIHKPVNPWIRTDNMVDYLEDTGATINVIEPCMTFALT